MAADYCLIICMTRDCNDASCRCCKHTEGESDVIGAVSCDVATDVTILRTDTIKDVS